MAYKCIRITIVCDADQLDELTHYFDHELPALEQPLAFYVLDEPTAEELDEVAERLRED